MPDLPQPEQPMTATAYDIADESLLARATAALPQLCAQVHTTAEDLAALRQPWRQLETVAHGATLFQSEAWCSRILATRGAEGTAVCTVTDGDRLVALLPLRTVDGPSGRIATGFGEPFQQYSDILVAPGYSPAASLRLMLAELQAKLRPDAIMLHKVRADSALNAAMTGYGLPSQSTPFVASMHEGGAPFTDLTPFTDFAQFQATISFKSRKNLRNARNRLGRNGAIEVIVDHGGPGLAAAIAGSHAGRLDWLDREGLVSRAFGDPAFPAFLDGLAAPERTGLDVLAVTIRAGGQPVAYQWGFVHKERYYAYIASWAPEYEDFSPGKMIMEDILRACHDRGIKIADFLMPASRYKFTWATGAMEVRDWSAPLTLRGRAIAWWTTRLRPALKALYLKLPAPLRTIARKVMAHG